MHETLACGKLEGQQWRKRSFLFFVARKHRNTHVFLRKQEGLPYCASLNVKKYNRVLKDNKGLKKKG
jgi:hypothetical protein